MSNLTPVIAIATSVKDARLSREFERTCSSVDTAMKTLGQRFQELSEKNARLRAQLTSNGQHEHDMARKHEEETAVLQQQVQTTKGTLEVLKCTLAQTISVNKQKTLDATIQQTEAIKKAKKIGAERIEVVKQQVAVAQQLALSKQVTSFQDRLGTIHQALERLKALCETEEAQLCADFTAACVAFDNEKDAFYKEKNRELHVYFNGGDFNKLWQDIQQVREDKSQKTIQLYRNMLRFLPILLILNHRRIETHFHREKLNNIINLLAKIK